MPRCNPPRWSLGALALVALALVALAVTGCGAAGNQRKLHNRSERRLLSLVAHARVAASQHHNIAIHTVLGEFVSEVHTLKTSGQLSSTTAGRLAREARATAAQAVWPSHPAKKAESKAGTAATTTTQPTATMTTQPTDPATTTSPAAAPTPKTPHDPRSNAADSKPKPNQDGDCSDSTWPGQVPTRGHGHGHRGWAGCGQGDDGPAGTAGAWANGRSYWTGGAGD